MLYPSPVAGRIVGRHLRRLVNRMQAISRTRPAIYSDDRLAPRTAGQRARGRRKGLMTADTVLGDASRTLADPLAEALRIVDLAERQGLQVRLMGGMAVRAHAPDWTHRTRRTEVDLDFATRGKDRPPSSSCSSARATRRTAATTRCSVGPRATSSTSRAAGRSTC